jgi:hypothetical protein
MMMTYLAIPQSVIVNNHNSNAKFTKVYLNNQVTIYGSLELILKLEISLFYIQKPQVFEYKKVKFLILGWILMISIPFS